MEASSSAALVPALCSILMLHEEANYYVVCNQFVEVTLAKPSGLITSIKYGGIDNLLEDKTTESNRGYWDMVWNGNFLKIFSPQSSVITNNEHKIELSFVKTYDGGADSLPLSIDKRFVFLAGSSGFYTYAVYHRESGWPAFRLDETRVTFKLRGEKFDFMALTDTKQRVMPYSQDRLPQNCQPLAYHEAVILTNPKNPDLKGEVDDKFQYSMENKDSRVHGWISSDPMVGFWIITPSYEFRLGGPLKQNLQAHCGPTVLSELHSDHYTGTDGSCSFSTNEAWEKVYGPIFVYLNRGSTHTALWDDAKRQTRTEISEWPYSWPASPRFHTASQRATVTGKLFVDDSYVSKNRYDAPFAMVGLALPGADWQTEGKGYQFWTEADVHGDFAIPHVVPGTYGLYGWVPGVIGDFVKQGNVVISKGGFVDLGKLVFSPPRSGPTLWEIGYPDRTASGFFVPDADHKYVNKLFVNQDKYRQYGLWLRYTDLYPHNDLVYDVNSSDWKKDWFFIHGLRFNKDAAPSSTRWEIKFKLQSVQRGTYTLQIAVASAAYARLQVGVNSNTNVYSSSMFGRDNAIARHGIHGVYHYMKVPIASGNLRTGDNSIFITQNNVKYTFSGVMYDYLRLEGPPQN